jgi:hypothetical protein
MTAVLSDDEVEEKAPEETPAPEPAPYDGRTAIVIPAIPMGALNTFQSAYRAACDGYARSTDEGGVTRRENYMADMRVAKDVLLAAMESNPATTYLVEEVLINYPEHVRALAERGALTWAQLIAVADDRGWCGEFERLVHKMHRAGGLTDQQIPPRWLEVHSANDEPWDRTTPSFQFPLADVPEPYPFEEIEVRLGIPEVRPNPLPEDDRRLGRRAYADAWASFVQITEENARRCDEAINTLYRRMERFSHRTMPRALYDRYQAQLNSDVERINRERARVRQEARRQLGEYANDDPFARWLFSGREMYNYDGYTAHVAPRLPITWADLTDMADRHDWCTDFEGRIELALQAGAVRRDQIPDGWLDVHRSNIQRTDRSYPSFEMGLLRIGEKSYAEAVERWWTSVTNANYTLDDGVASARRAQRAERNDDGFRVQINNLETAHYRALGAARRKLREAFDGDMTAHGLLDLAYRDPTLESIARFILSRMPLTFDALCREADRQGVGITFERMVHLAVQRRVFDAQIMPNAWLDRHTPHGRVVSPRTR